MEERIQLHWVACGEGMGAVPPISAELCSFRRMQGSPFHEFSFQQEEA